MDRSAGIILIRDIGGEPHILGLRAYTTYDLPKGKIEDGESDLDAAIRETSEEAGVTVLKFAWGHETVRLQNYGKRKKQVTLFIAETDEEPVIRKNPESGEYEHHGVKWLTFDEAETKLHPYLRPAVAWARARVSSRETIREFVGLHIDSKS